MGFLLLFKEEIERGKNVNREVGRLGNDLEAAVSVEGILVCVSTLSRYRDNYPIALAGLQVDQPA